MRALIVLFPETDSESQDKENGIRSKTSTRKYSEGWDRIFGKEPKSEIPADPKTLN